VALEFVVLLRWHFPPFWLPLLAQPNCRHAFYQKSRLKLHTSLLAVCSEGVDNLDKCRSTNKYSSSSPKRVGSTIYCQSMGRLAGVHQRSTRSCSSASLTSASLWRLDDGSSCDGSGSASLRRGSPNRSRAEVRHNTLRTAFVPPLPRASRCKRAPRIGLQRWKWETSPSQHD